jgi:flagellar protein FliS
MDTIGNYLRSKVMSASPGELILMLYEEGIRTLKKAEEAFAIETPDRFQTISNNLLHAQDVITELSVSLDMEKGGEIAKNLQKLYDFMVHHLSKGNADKVKAPVTEIRELMTELQGAWRQVVEKELAEEPDAPRAQVQERRILAAG